MSATKDRTRANVGTKLIGEYVTDDYTLQLNGFEDLLECRGSITVHDLSGSLSPSELISILRKHNIVETVDLEQIAIFCTAAAQGENPRDTLLAQGLAPEKGKDGWFELIVSTGKEKSEWVEDESGRVDFKAVQNFSNVEIGEHIGNIYPPTAGRAGKTVTGELILPRSGNPAHIIAGSGVRFSADGRQALATQSGRVVYDNNILSVAEEFVVNGNVDLSIGHITFNGFVDIKGDVLDDFNITATKGIKVSGAVGACRINCDGPVTIGTMTGKGVGKIICRGTLRARYLNQVTVECRGDILISHEARNCILKSTGSIRLASGQISGGEAIALEGIEANAFGARSGIKTHLTAGIFFPETDRLIYLRKELKSITEQMKRIGDTLKALNKKPLPAGRPALREAIELRIGILTQRQVNLDEEREALSAELLDFSLEEHASARPKINVLSTLMEGVIIHLGETTTEIDSQRSGPLSIVENVEQGGLRYLGFSPLTVTDITPAEPVPN